MPGIHWIKLYCFIEVLLHEHRGVYMDLGMKRSSRSKYISQIEYLCKVCIRVR